MAASWLIGRCEMYVTCEGRGGGGGCGVGGWMAIKVLVGAGLGEVGVGGGMVPGGRPSVPILGRCPGGVREVGHGWPGACVTSGRDEPQWLP